MRCSRFRTEHGPELSMFRVQDWGRVTRLLPRRSGFWSEHSRYTIAGSRVRDCGRVMGLLPRRSGLGDGSMVRTQPLEVAGSRVRDLGRVLSVLPRSLGVRPISLLTLSLLILLDSNFPGNAPCAWESHPFKLRLCSSQTL